MTTRLLILAGLSGWLGATLLLAEWHRFARPNLTDRLRPFSPTSSVVSPQRGLLSVESLRDIVGPLSRGAGDRVASLFGISEELSLRLHRIHSPLDVTAFRVRQFAWSGSAAAVGLLIAVTGLPLPLTALTVVGAPLLVFLLIEQRTLSTSQRWQDHLSRELPVVSEQLAMLLSAGYSLGSALNRLAARGHGCCARDLRGVVNRTRQGLDEAEALREWAAIARVDALDRLVSVLTLNSDAGDLGRLVSAEARQARRELHRRTSELIERRSEQVWIPVTVATLVPGAILLAIPFLAALRQFSSA